MNLGRFTHVHGVDISPSLISIYADDQELMIPYSARHDARMFNAFAPDKPPRIKAWAILDHVHPTDVVEISATPEQLTITTTDGSLSWSIQPKQ